jgi:GAF domain-containing protein
MISNTTHDSSKRINKLRNLNILDTPKESEFESIVEIATYICDVPISVVGFFDEKRQWFKAVRGFGEMTETPAKTSFCLHTINSVDGKLQVRDLKRDERFIDNPFVVNAPNIQFYAGISITTSDRERIGAVCIMDIKARELNSKQIKCLELLAEYATKLIELRELNTELTHQKGMLMSLNDDLK